MKEYLKLSRVEKEQSEKKIDVLFSERIATNSIFIKEKKAQRNSLQEVIEILQNPTYEDLLEAKYILEEHNIEQTDIEHALELFEADRMTADAFLQKAIGDIEKIILERTKQALLKVAYKYSSTQINLPKDLAEKVISWGKKNILEEEIYSDPDSTTSYGTMGREDNPHVTVKYGLHTGKVSDVESVVKGFGPVEISLGQVSIFEPEGKDNDVVKVEVESNSLRELNKKVSTLENSDEHPEYKPHVTIAYVKKGEGQKYVGREDFKGMKFTSDDLVFSASSGDTKVENKKEIIKLS